MAPPNDPVNSLFRFHRSEPLEKIYDLSNGKFSVRACSCSVSKGGFLGFCKEEPSDRLTNSLGRFKDRDFLSIFRFKTWWSTMWVGNSGSDLQMETQWVLFDVPQIKSYVLLIPIIEGRFRSALQPGSNGHVIISAESGSAQVKSSNFDAIAYVHLSNNPYNLMKEAITALRVHLNTFRLLEEKTVPNLVDKFGWCTWDAFYLTVEPVGIWHGVNDFAEGGISPRFLIIDDGWQSVNLDDENPTEDKKNLVLGGTQMTGRLHRLDEGEKFRKYKGGTMLGPNAPPFDPKKPKFLISKAIEIEHTEKARDKAIQSGVTDMSEFETKIQKFKQELDDIFGKEESNVLSQGCGSCSCKGENYGLVAFTRDLRTKFKGLDDIYVWHALCGTWGGVRPGTTHLDSKIVPCKLSPGLDGTMDDLAVIKLIEGGIGLVNPEQASDFYDSMHSHLVKSGITGVKVDVIHTLEYVSEEYGGRVELAKAYYKGITESLSKNFKGSGLISSMQQGNDFFFLGTNQISIGRVGDDFWFQDPNGDPMGVYWLQGVHMIHCAYNSLWMGQIIQPDWDMFQSDHLCAKFHAGSRAICGGPIYVSDSVGDHDFDLLKKLVYPDGTIPKCQHFALPTRDCLFKNPLFDQKTILKIWNFNRYGGVIGAFNCQGAGWVPKERRIRCYSECYKPISGSVHVSDIEWDQNLKAAQMAEEYVVYLNQAEELKLMTPKSDPIQVTIQPSTFELFSFVPITKLSGNIKFAPIGLTNMFNSGGTIQELRYGESIGADIGAQVTVKGGGNFIAYSNVSPKKCKLNGAEVTFEWLADGKLALNLPWIEEAEGISVVDFLF
ncbi:Stachyose synthase [Quillaja saponaria]|uniref:Stachyose synthase n=1 Tax=Quillaja saponaria TaxID=32244 RepID=A0AAD7QA26_QUISA|nr:Stachyose synthase [Quillaja saponaria]